MSWLAPLYLAGMFAVAGPIVFHLWRRTPQGRRVFSTLMFLKPSPPRMTRLSNIEHWLLLLLRGLALLLMALAFARPVWRIPATTPVARDEGEFLAVLVDASASMGREGLWQQAVEATQKRLETLPDSVIPALYVFDDRWTAALTFEESSQLNPAARRPLLVERLTAFQPTMRGTHLGEALVRTAQALQEAQSGRALPRPQRIWLASDLQTGSEISALRAFDWPTDIPVEWLAVAPAQPTNAGLQLVATTLDSGDTRLRVRITNDAASIGQQFTVNWGDAAADTKPIETVLVPPGQSRVIALPEPPAPEFGRSVALKGDQHPFDNRLWLPRRAPRPVRVLYSGTDDGNDTTGQRFYLTSALASNPLYRVEVVTGTEALLPASAPELVVVAVLPKDEGLKRFIVDHRRVVLIPPNADEAKLLLSACGWPSPELAEARIRDYALWSEIDFESPWFAPFAEAQFADFSGIHFWKHRRVMGTLPAGSSVLARFDDRDPAIIEWRRQDRQLWFFAAGWHPADSQLARSTKFVPLVWRMLEYALGDRPTATAATVGLPLPMVAVDREAVIRRPDGGLLTWLPTDPLPVIEAPGLFEVQSGSERTTVAANLPPDESRTDPLAPEQLEAYGVRWSTKALKPVAPLTAEQLRQQQMAELEQQQQLWRWGLLAAVVLLIGESWLSAWWQRQPASFANSG